MNQGSRRRRDREHRPLIQLPPTLSALLSMIIPGLGQVVAGWAGRGFLLFGSVISAAGLLLWRFNQTARRETEFFAMVKKSYKLEPLLIGITIGIAILYLWIAFDAYRISRRTPGSAISLFLWVAVLFFGLGWQIGEINPTDLITGLEEGRDTLSRVVWPWERAITRQKFLVQASADLQVPCQPPNPSVNEPLAEEPYLIVEPTCGELAEQEAGQGEIPGTPLSVIGGNFRPNQPVELMWEDPIGNEFRHRQEGTFLSITTGPEGTFEINITMPYRLLPPSVSEEAQIWELSAQQEVGEGPVEPSRELRLAVGRMVETIFLGMMATFFGIIFSVPVSFLAARNLMSANALTLGIYFLTRTILNIVRSIEPLIWAVIAVVVVGLGPFAGILALTLHTIAALGKLYSESIESIDPGPIEAIQATGANWVQTVVYAVIPQIIPPFISFTIYRWDINVRMSTVIGLVGGGGIGFLLIQWIRLLDYRAAGIAVWFIAITVAILDYVSSEIRQRFV